MALCELLDAVRFRQRQGLCMILMQMTAQLVSVYCAVQDSMMRSHVCVRLQGQSHNYSTVLSKRHGDISDSIPAADWISDP